MQDFISNGNGDSRYLKSVSDFLTRYPTYEDMAAALVAGTLPIDLNGINSSGVQQRGTPYNKASVLSDDTAWRYGLYSSTATVNDALSTIITPGNDQIRIVSGQRSGSIIGSRATSEGYGNAAGTETCHVEGSGNIVSLRGYSHAEGASTICAAPHQVFKVTSGSSTTKIITFDRNYGNFSDAFAALTVGSKLAIYNGFYVGDFGVFTVASVGETNTVTVEESLWTNFIGTYAVNLSAARKSFYDTTYPAHVEGSENVATGANAHAEGWMTLATGHTNHAEGNQTTASGEYAAHSEGISTIASGDYSHAEGNTTTASGQYSHSEGGFTIASGHGSHAGGIGTNASADAQTAIGEYNVISSSESDRFIIGKGSSRSRANAFRVNDTGVYGSGAYNSSGADYAEMFEWEDGNPRNEDRTGKFVTLSGDKIKMASQEDDFILGIVSGNPSVVGDVYDDQWRGMYQHDVFGRSLWETVEIPERKDTVTIPAENEADEPKTQTRVISPARTVLMQKINPEYDESKTYIKRSERQEWDAVGMLGKLIVVDDGTCEVNGWAKVGKGGIAVNSDERTSYRVMKRLDKKHVQLLIL